MRMIKEYKKIKNYLYGFLVAGALFLSAEEKNTVSQSHEIIIKRLLKQADRYLHQTKGKKRTKCKKNKSTITPGMVLNIGADARQNHFELQLAKSGENQIEVISQEEIANGFAEAPYFTVVHYNGYDTVQFEVQIDAPTTSGSKYPRSELRQVKADGTKASFDAMSGTYSLQGSTRITHLPAVKPEVVIAQLFDGSRDRIAIRTQVINNKINLVVRVNGTTVQPYLATPYIVGIEFDWKILVVDGIASIYFNHMDIPVITDQQLYSTGTASWYFKAGCYSQTNSSIEKDPSEYVSTELRNLMEMSHLD